MAVIRFPEEIFRQARDHLLSRGPERFAFFLAGWSQSGGEPVLNVRDLILVPDSSVDVDLDGYDVDPTEVIGAVNAAVRSKSALIEAHSHGGEHPRFSNFPDRPGILETSNYILASLPDRPYAATVWGDSAIYGEYFRPDGTTGHVRSFPVVGRRLQQLATGFERPTAAGPRRFDRQVPWFTPTGQRQLGLLRVGIVGLGGTGSHVVQQLAYLGINDFCLVEDDNADETNLNRLVTAKRLDVGVPKVELASRLIRSVAPGARVTSIRGDVQSRIALDALKGVDLMFGCVDNDGARLVLNELAVAFEVPYLDVAAGIVTDRDGRVEEAGGRLAVVIPGGPCLVCMDEIDVAEAGFFLSLPAEREMAQRRGYVQDVAAPAVVSLNGAISSLAINELSAWVSGIRPPQAYTELDLIGRSRSQRAQWVTPRSVQRRDGCPTCALGAVGERADLERFARVSRTPEPA